MNILEKQIGFGIRIKDALIVCAIYIIMSWVYTVTLWRNRADFSKNENPLFTMDNFLDDGGIQYAIFLVFSIPIWILIFRISRKKPLRFRLLLHLITMPIFVLGAQKVYYLIIEQLGFGHLRGSSQIWDIYIPSLIYLIQFGILHAYEYYKENQRKLIIEGELRQAALKSELAAIKAQLNPHFLYNVFNTINASVPPKQEKTRMLIATLSDLFRYQLKASKKELVSLEEELEFVKKYLELEKARFEERLNIRINVSKELYSEKIPPMLLQPLVENSVKHGISASLEGGEISISIFKEESKLKFEIADTGKGVTDKKSMFGKGIGLSNTQLRLQKMYQSQLEILDNQPQGLKIRFAI